MATSQAHLDLVAADQTADFVWLVATSQAGSLVRTYHPGMKPSLVVANQMSIAVWLSTTSQGR